MSWWLLDWEEQQQGSTPLTDSTQSYTTAPTQTPVPGAIALLGSYATYEQFLARFEEKETRELSVAGVSAPITTNQPRVGAALADASALIDSYLNAKYDVAPLHTAPTGELIRHTCNIARYYLAQNRAPEQYREMFDDAIAWCEHQLKDGQVIVTSNGRRLEQTGAGDEPIDGVVGADGVIYRAEAFSSNMPRRAFSQEQFAQQRFNTRGGRRWR